MDHSKTKILYVPLDDRDCNYNFPYFLCQMTDDCEILRPPYEWMGKLKEPADCGRIWEWLFENVKDCQYCILSVDTLVYGNIVNSRTHHLSEEECSRRLEGFRKLKTINPEVHIHAFNLVARVAAYNSSQEDPDYWENYGEDIWKYTWLLDKERQIGVSPEEKKEIETLKDTIPQDYLTDFLERRKVDRFVNLQSVKLTRDGVFDILTVPKDDTAEYGYAAMDQAVLAGKIREERLYDRVFVYPGADEVGSVLFARVFNEVHHYVPAVYVRYSSINGPAVCPRYEDRPLGESIKWQITSAGGIITETPTDSDCMLAVNCSGTRQYESADQLNRPVSYKNNTNSEELLRYISYYREKYDKAIGVSDVSTSNGCDNEFMDNACLHGTFDKIDAVGGWNTAENTNGVVIAQMMIAAYYDRFRGCSRQMEASDTFFARSLVADWLSQANVAREFYEDYAPAHGIDPYRLHDCMDEVTGFYEKRIDELLGEKLHHSIKGRKVVLDRVRFNWDGAFYFAADCSLK